ncbi:MAG: hypothetical protein AB1730_04290 [Myxococcota bacterium]
MRHFAIVLPLVALAGRTCGEVHIGGNGGGTGGGGATGGGSGGGSGGGLAADWRRIGGGLAADWRRIGGGLAADWRRRHAAGRWLRHGLRRRRLRRGELLTFGVAGVRRRVLREGRGVPLRPLRDAGHGVSHRQRPRGGRVLRDGAGERRRPRGRGRQRLGASYAGLHHEPLHFG